jgi:hypothetical protein
MRWKYDYIGCCVEDCSGSKKWKRITIVQNCISGTKLVLLIGIHAIIIRLLQEIVFHPPLPKDRGFWDAKTSRSALPAEAAFPVSVPVSKIKQLTGK